MEERVVILVRNEDPLCVEKERLTKNSEFIGYLIDDEDQLEMNDFEPDMVALFLTLLEDGKLTELQTSQFRELHKMATVFKVTWLKQECRNWLFTWLERKEDIKREEADGEKTVEKPGKNKSGKERNKDTYKDLFFVFEECLFVLRKWEGAEMDMMETFMAKRAGKDNSSFVAKYLENFAKLDTIQLGWMLKMEVTNMAIFLEPLLIYIANKESLDHRIRFMLKNTDLVNCCSHNRQTFDDLFRGLRSMKELTRDDTGFILELYMETMESILAKTTKGKKSVALTTTSSSEITAMAGESSSRTAGSSSRTAESSSRTAESSSRTAESSSRTAESSSKTAGSSSRTARSSSKTAESSLKTAESSSKTAESSSKTAGSSSRTAESSSRTGGSSSRTAGSSSRTAGSSLRTAGSSSRAADLSSRTAESSSRTAGSSSRAADLSSRTAESSLRTTGSSLRTAESSLRTAESSSRTSGSSSRTADSPSKTAGSSLRTAGSSSRTAESSSRTADSPSKTAGSSLRTAGSSSRTAGSSSRAAESSSRTAESSLRTADSPSKTAGSSLRTAGSSSRTADSSLRTAGSTSRTAESFLRTAESSSRTAGSSLRTAGSSSRAADLSSRTAESSLRTAESSSRTAGSSLRTAGLSLRTAGSSSRTAESSSRTAGSDSSEETSPEQKTVLFDGWECSQLAVNCTRIWAISELIYNGAITSMFQVIELLLQVYYKMTVFPGAKELTNFKRELRTACVNRKMQKASPKYINMITSALIHSPFQQKTTLTRLLNSFIKDEILCSQTENLNLQETRCIEDPQRGGYKHVFYLPRDSKMSRDCCLPGTCGFIVKGGPGGRNQYWLDELCAKEEDYQGTGVHYHGDVIARDMFYYYIWSGAREIGTLVRIPDRALASCKQWLPDVTNWVTECVSVQYKLSN